MPSGAPGLPSGKPTTGSPKRKAKEPGSVVSNRSSVSPALSLGLILRTLDGGSETPGRVIVMTTNREELLDEAFKRPGRVKKVHMDNLAYPEFKQMILHFRRFQGKVPTVSLWTKAVDQMAQRVMDDYRVLQGLRTGDLDRRR